MRGSELTFETSKDGQGEEDQVNLKGQTKEVQKVRQDQALDGAPGNSLQEKMVSMTVNEDLWKT